MTIKEKPLINAMSRWGMMPGFLFANSLIAGFTTIQLCAVFGVFFMMFQAYGRGVADAYELLQYFRLGAFAIVGLGLLFSIALGVRAVWRQEEAKERLLFLLGAILGVVAFALLTWLTWEPLNVGASELGDV
ncbi:MAG: hypothetical protein AAGC95_13995 [Pseudomonadota bacterium]